MKKEKENNFEDDRLNLETNYYMSDYMIDITFWDLFDSYILYLAKKMLTFDIECVGYSYLDYLNPDNKKNDEIFWLNNILELKPLMVDKFDTYTEENALALRIVFRDGMDIQLSMVISENSKINFVSGISDIHQYDYVRFRVEEFIYDIINIYSNYDKYKADLEEECKMLGASNIIDLINMNDEDFNQVLENNRTFNFS